MIGAALSLLPLIVAALLLIGFHWKSHEAGLVLLLLTIVLVSLLPTFHQTAAQLATAIGQGLTQVLMMCAVLLPTLFFIYAQYATQTTLLTVKVLTRLLPARDLHTLFLVLGLGPCLEAWYGHGVGTLLILPLLAYLHHDRVKAVELGVLSHVMAAWGASGSSGQAMSSAMIVLLAPSVCGASLLVVWLSRHKRASRRHWGTACVVALAMLLTKWLTSRFFTANDASLVTSLLVMSLLVGRSFFLTQKPFNEHERQNHHVWENRHQGLALLPYGVLLTGVRVGRLPVLYQTPLLSWYLPGLCLLCATLILLRCFPLHWKQLVRVQTLLWRELWPIVGTICGFLIATSLLQQSGMLATFIHTLGPYSAWLAPMIGAMAGWLTQNAAGSHALLVPLHMPASSAIGLPGWWVIAAQSSAAALASAIAPVQVLLMGAILGGKDTDDWIFRRGVRLVGWAGALTSALFFWLIAPSWEMRVSMLLGTCLVIGVLLQRSEMGWVAWMRMAHVNGHISDRLPKSGTRFLRRVWQILHWWLPYGALVLVNVLYASSSLVSLEPVSRIDPVLFLCLQMLLLVPVGLLLLVWSHVTITRAILLRGVQLGACLAAGLLCAALSLRETGMMETTIFSCLNGVVAAIVAWWFFGQRISRWTWATCFCSLLGAFLVWLTAPVTWQSNVTAFVAGLLLTYDGFQVEQLLADYGPDQAPTVRAILGAQCLAMAVLTTLVALCFGHWQTLRLLVPSDLLSLSYLSYVTILLPCLLMLWAQRSLSAVTVACFSVIEPFTSMGAAALLAGERLPPLALLGGGVVLVGVVIQGVTQRIYENVNATHRPTNSLNRDKAHTETLKFALKRYIESGR